MPDSIPSSANMGNTSVSYTSTPYSTGQGEFGRSWLGQAIGFGGYADSDDWIRQEQSANNAYLRSLGMLQEENKFNASEAQKNRDFQREMSNTAYQRAVADMKKAGINPALLLGSQGGASTPSGLSASSGSGSVGSGSRSPRGGNGSEVVATIAKLVAGLVSTTASLTSAGISASSRIKSAEIGANSKFRRYK